MGSFIKDRVVVEAERAWEAFIKVLQWWTY